MVEHLLPFASTEAVLDAVTWASLDKLKSTAFVETASGLPVGGTYAVGKVTAEHVGNDDIQLSIDAPEDGFLVVINSFSPYWKARVDGVETPIYPVYGMFWGVRIPKGTKSVLFKYQEPSVLSQ